MPGHFRPSLQCDTENVHHYQYYLVHAFETSTPACSRVGDLVAMHLANPKLVTHAPIAAEFAPGR